MEQPKAGEVWEWAGLVLLLLSKERSLQLTTIEAGRVRPFGTRTMAKHLDAPRHRSRRIT